MESIFSAYLIDNYQTVYIPNDPKLSDLTTKSTYDTGNAETMTQRQMLKGAFYWKYAGGKWLAYC